jgi:hypothetical protein
MRLEFKRFLHSAYALVAFGLTVLFYAGGYGAQAVYYTDGVSLLQCYQGAYTFYGQFGPLVLGAFAMHYITSDYANKNILFYRRLGFSSLTYYLTKTLTLIAFFAVANAVVSLAVCAAYGDFSPWLVMLLQTTALLITYFSLFCAVAIAIGKFVASYFAYLVWWLVVSTTINYGLAWTQWLQYFDANAHLNQAMLANMANASTFASEQMGLLGGAMAYAAAVFAIGALFSLVVKKRWLQNGIR